MSFIRHRRHVGWVPQSIGR